MITLEIKLVPKKCVIRIENNSTDFLCSLNVIIIKLMDDFDFYLYM